MSKKNQKRSVETRPFVHRAEVKVRSLIDWSDLESFANEAIRVDSFWSTISKSRLRAASVATMHSCEKHMYRVAVDQKLEKLIPLFKFHRRRAKESENRLNWHKKQMLLLQEQISVTRGSGVPRLLKAASETRKRESANAKAQPAKTGPKDPSQGTVMGRFIALVKASPGLTPASYGKQITDKKWSWAKLAKQLESKGLISIRNGLCYVA